MQEESGFENISVHQADYSNLNNMYYENIHFLFFYLIRVSLVITGPEQDLPNYVWSLGAGEEIFSVLQDKSGNFNLESMYYLMQILLIITVPEESSTEKVWVRWYQVMVVVKEVGKWEKTVIESQLFLLIILRIKWIFCSAYLLTHLLTISIWYTCKFLMNNEYAE